MSQFKLNIIRLWLLLAFGSSQLSGVDDTIKVVLTQNRIIDVCSTDPVENSCLIAINLGDIKRSDSIFGYDFGLSYNNQKLRFDRALYVGTLAESFEFNVAGIESEGIVIGRGGHIDYRLPPVEGNLPLVVLRFRYIQACPDTSFVKLDYLEFTDEFQKKIDLTNAIIFAEAKEFDKPNRALKTKFNVDSLFFEKDSLKEAELSFIAGSVSRLDTLIADLIYDNKAFEVVKITQIDSNFILEFEKLTKGLRISLFNLAGKDTILLKLMFKSLKNEDILSDAIVENFKINFCSCVTRFESASVTLKNKKDTTDDTTSIVDDNNNRNDINVSYNSNTNDYIIDSKNLIMCLKIYDINGRNVGNYKYDYTKKAVINLSNYNFGIYLAIVINDKNELNRIVLIKSYY